MKNIQNYKKRFSYINRLIVNFCSICVILQGCSKLQKVNGFINSDKKAKHVLEVDKNVSSHFIKADDNAEGLDLSLLCIKYKQSYNSKKNSLLTHNLKGLKVMDTFFKHFYKKIYAIDSFRESLSNDFCNFDNIEHSMSATLFEVIPGSQTQRNGELYYQVKIKSLAPVAYYVYLFLRSTYESLKSGQDTEKYLENTSLLAKFLGRVPGLFRSQFFFELNKLFTFDKYRPGFRGFMNKFIHVSTEFGEYPKSYSLIILPTDLDYYHSSNTKMTIPEEYFRCFNIKNLANDTPYYLLFFQQIMRFLSEGSPEIGTKYPGTFFSDMWPNRGEDEIKEEYKKAFFTAPKLQKNEYCKADKLRYALVKQLSSKIKDYNNCKEENEQKELLLKIYGSLFTTRFHYEGAATPQLFRDLIANKRDVMRGFISEVLIKAQEKVKTIHDKEVLKKLLSDFFSAYTNQRCVYGCVYKKRKKKLYQTKPEKYIKNIDNVYIFDTEDINAIVGTLNKRYKEWTPELTNIVGGFVSGSKVCLEIDGFFYEVLKRLAEIENRENKEGLPIFYDLFAKNIEYTRLDNSREVTRYLLSSYKDRIISLDQLTDLFIEKYFCFNSLGKLPCYGRNDRYREHFDVLLHEMIKEEKHLLKFISKLTAKKVPWYLHGKEMNDIYNMAKNKGYEGAIKSLKTYISNEKLHGSYGSISEGDSIFRQERYFKRPVVNWGLLSILFKALPIEKAMAIFSQYLSDSHFRLRGEGYQYFEINNEVTEKVLIFLKNNCLKFIENKLNEIKNLNGLKLNFEKNPLYLFIYAFTEKNAGTSTSVVFEQLDFNKLHKGFIKELSEENKKKWTTILEHIKKERKNHEKTGSLTIKDHYYHIDYSAVNEMFEEISKTKLSNETKDES